MIRISAPSHPIKASLHLSGSKSLSNRFLVLNEVLKLGDDFQNLSDSEDTQLLQKALSQIKSKTNPVIDIHHAGSDMRFLTALLSVTEGEWTLTGSDRMKQRPIGELVNALKILGADIDYLEKENFPPLLIKGKKLKGGTIEIDSSVSSQFISALLLISPVFENGLALTLKGKTVSMPYIEMTIALLNSYGISIKQHENLITVGPSSTLRSSSSIKIESDWSSASYWYGICALSKSTEMELSFLNEKSLQADSVLPELYKELGVKTTFNENSITLNSVDLLRTEFNYDFTNCPDIAQTLAVTCFGLGLKAKLTGLSTLKVKETDRIVALKNELEKLGAKIKITSESLELEASGNKKENGSLKTDLSEQIISTYNDHRMAMSFAPLALRFDKIEIENPSVVTKSYPAFWEDLKSVGFNVNSQL